MNRDIARPSIALVRGLFKGGGSPDEPVALQDRRPARRARKDKTKKWDT